MHSLICTMVLLDMKVVSCWRQPHAGSGLLTPGSYDRDAPSQQMITMSSAESLGKSIEEGQIRLACSVDGAGIHAGPTHVARLTPCRKSEGASLINCCSGAALAMAARLVTRSATAFKECKFSSDQIGSMLLPF